MCASASAARLGHRVHQVEPDPRLGQHVSDEHALVDLEAGLLLLGKLAFVGDGFPSRHEPRVALGGAVHELRTRGLSRRPSVSSS